MTIKRLGLGGVVATMAAVVALGGAAPAQAQLEVDGDAYLVCFSESAPADLDGRCMEEPNRVCVYAYCVEGVWANYEGARLVVDRTKQTVLDAIPPLPQRICTPELFSGPICISR